MRLINNMRLCAVGHAHNFRPRPPKYELVQGRSIRGVANVRKSYQLLEKLGEMTSIGDSEDSILLHESVIRGHHVFKEVWSPFAIVSRQVEHCHPTFFGIQQPFPLRFLEKQ